MHRFLPCLTPLITYLCPSLRCCKCCTSSDNASGDDNQEQEGEEGQGGDKMQDGNYFASSQELYASESRPSRSDASTYMEEDVDARESRFSRRSSALSNVYLDNERDSTIGIVCEGEGDVLLEEMDEGQLIEEVVRREMNSMQRINTLQIAAAAAAAAAVDQVSSPFSTSSSANGIELIEGSSIRDPHLVKRQDQSIDTTSSRYGAQSIASFAL